MKKCIMLLALVLTINVTNLLAQTRETRTVGTFTKLSFRLPGKLYIRQGNTQKVEIEASTSVLKQIETKLEGPHLSIEKEGSWNDWNWAKGETINIYITVKNLEAVNLSGSGDLIGETTFVTSDIDLKVSGSGSLKMDIESSGEVEADVSGSGQLAIKGKCKNLDSDVSGSGRVKIDMAIANNVEFEISGSGKIEARGTSNQVKTSISGSGKVLGADLQTNRCEVRISGSGDVEISVKDEIDARISGSGSVSYKGNPGKINSHSSGSGTVSKM